MRFIRLFLISCIATGAVLLSACASGPLRARGQALEDALQRAGTFDSRCVTGINMRQDGTVLYLSNRAQDEGLRSGDRIVALDSKPFEDTTAFIAVIRRLEPGTIVHLSIQRQGTRKQIDVECHDDSNVQAMERQLIEAMKDGDRAGCLHILSMLSGEWPATGWQYSASYDCRFDGRRGQTQYDEFEAGYTIWRVKLEEVTTNATALEAIKPRVLQVIQWLQAGGYRSLAQELDYKLALAERVTYGAASTASARNGTEPEPSTQRQEAPPESSASIMLGTGFAVAPDGTLITCAHVVKNGKNTDIAITTADGIQHKASIVALDLNNDLAVLKPETVTPNYLVLSPAEEAGLGDKLFTIGFPTPTMLGFNPKYSEGALAALSGLKDDPRFIQMSIPIQPGNSGGPVVNPKGRVVGVVDATVDIASFLDESNGQLPQGINFAVKSEFVKTLLKDNGIAPAAPNLGPNVTDAVRRSVVLIVAEGKAAD